LTYNLFFKSKLYKSTNTSIGIEELLNSRVKLKRLWEDLELLNWLRVEFERGLETKVVLEEDSSLLIFQDNP